MSDYHCFAPAEFCDHCGEPFKLENLRAYDNVPWNTASANKGESAVLCFDCISNFKCEDREALDNR